MKKKIDINSEEWRNLIFKGRNKNYGAYYLRKKSQSGYVWGFIFMLLFSGLTIFCLSKTRYIDTAPLAIIPDDGCGGWGEDIRTFDLPEIPAPPKILTLSCTFAVPDIVPDSLVIKMHSNIKVEEGVLNEEGSFTPIPFLSPSIETDNPIGLIEIESISKKICSFPFDEVSDSYLIEQEAQFPGGSNELTRFIVSNIKYPYSARETESEGLVVAKFIIQKNGSAENIQIVSGLNYACDNEVLKVIKKMPKWIPAKQNGQSICTSFILPVRFSLKNDKI